MTREAYVDLSENAAARLLDRVIVKGKTTPLELMEIRHQFSRVNFDEIAQRYGEAFALYERGDFPNARTIFTELSEQADDRPSSLMANRCLELERQAASDWHGVYKLESK